MAKGAVKQKAIPVPAKAPEPSIDRAELIDEFGGIVRRLAGTADLQARYIQLRSMILAWHKDVPAAAPIDEDGYRYSFHASPAAEQREIVSMQRLRDRLGAVKFLKHCSFSLEKLDRVLPPDGQVGLVITRRTGPRQVKAISRLRDPAATR